MEAKEVAVARGATANADFVLHPACLEEGSYVDGGLRWGLQAAQAILYVRLTAVSEPDRWIVNDQCIVGIDHTTTVLSILNMGADSGTIKKTIHIVRDGRVGWNPGDEYIAFVRWEPAIGRYRPIAGPIFMIPVLNGKVVWDRTDAPNIRTGDPVSKAMALSSCSCPGGAEAQFTELIGARAGMRVLWRVMAEPSGGHPGRRVRVKAIRSCTTVMVRDLRCSHASRGASTKEAAADRPRVRDRAGCRISATFRLYHCSRRRHSERARISVDAQRREPASTLVPDHQPGHVPIRVQGRLRHYPSRLAGLLYDRCFPGRPSASRHWGDESLIVSSEAIREPFYDHGSRGLTCSWILAFVFLMPFVAAPAAKKYLDRRRDARRHVELCRRFRPRVRTAIPRRHPSDRPIAATVRCAPCRRDDWRFCSHQRRDTAIPICRTTGRISCTTSSASFESSRLNRLSCREPYQQGRWVVIPFQRNPVVPPQEGAK